MDGRLSPSELRLEAASEGVTLLTAGTATLITLQAGSPPLTLVGVTLAGQLVVLNGSLQLENCTVQMRQTTERRLSSSLMTTSGHAVIVAGGSVLLLNVLLRENSGGAVSVVAGVLHMRQCSLLSNSAARGAALYVGGGTVTVEETAILDNAASESGGGLFVSGGRVIISNRTLLQRNTAPRGAGASIFSTVALRYGLPTPLSRWVLIPDGRGEATLAAGAVDDDFPYPCSAGLYGNSYDPADQSGPQCSGACPAGYSCGTATIDPAPCPNGTFCRAGSPAPSDCPAGTVGLRPKLTEEAACDECEAGTYCPMGTAAVLPCSLGTYSPMAGLGACRTCPAGSFQGTTGQTACDQCSGGYCPEGSAAPVACAAGTTSSGRGLQAADECQICPLGSYCLEGTSEPAACPAGTAGRATGLGAIEFCSVCPGLMASAAGGSACTWCKEGYYAQPSLLTTGEVSCTSCPELGAVCPVNSTLSTMELARGYWRLSPTVPALSACVVKTNSSHTVSACIGGRDAGDDGSGYCMAGHHGPLCQVCETNHSHFDHTSGFCGSCPRLSGSVSAASVVVGMLIALALLGGLAMLICRSRTFDTVRTIAMSIRRLVSKVRKLHLMPRIKLLIMFYQIVIAMPQVYGISLPQWYSSTMSSFGFIDPDWTNFLLPGACINFRTRLLLRGVVPLLLLALIACLAAVRECAQAYVHRRRASLRQALLAALPAMLFVAHVLCPRVSAGIFSAWDCDSFALDSNGAERSFLHEDLSVVCAEAGVTTTEHAQLTWLAAVFVVIWPVGLPVCDLLLLFPSRRSIRQRRTTRWVLATEYLHKEYQLAYYWWDVVPLLLRLTLSGFVVLIPEHLEMWRILIGTMIALLYLIVLELIHPYKRRDVNYIAISTHVSLVCVFLGATFLKFYNRLSEAYSSEDAEEITGFSSGKRIVIAMLAFNLSVLVLIGGLTIYQFGTEDSLPTIRRIGSGRVPELSIAEGLTYHLFLSHKWSSGQDQMAIVKSQLQLLLPSVRVFLDVDELDPIDNLEQPVELSQSVLLFLSRGCFFSTNVQRDLRASLRHDKPLVLLHESDMSRGGVSLEQLKKECPQSSGLRLRDFVFEGREVILWLRSREFQLVSLKMIVSLVLAHAQPTPVPSPTSTPPGSSEESPSGPSSGVPQRLSLRLRRSLASPPQSPSSRNGLQPLGSELYIPGDEISRKRLTLVKPTTVIVSSNNPGAAAVAEELQAQDARLSVASYDEFQLALSFINSFGRSASSRISLSQQLRQLPLRAQQRVQRLKRLRKLATSNEVFLLYLDALTWEDEAGNRLATEVAEVMRAGYTLILLHEQDPQRQRCEFDRFLMVTPADLLAEGIYKQLSIPMYHGPHRQVSLALAAKELGAVHLRKTERIVRSTLSGALERASQLSASLRSSRSSCPEPAIAHVRPAPSDASRAELPEGSALPAGAPGSERALEGLHAEAQAPDRVLTRANSTKRGIQSWLAERESSFSLSRSNSNSSRSGDFGIGATQRLPRRASVMARLSVPKRFGKPRHGQGPKVKQPAPQTLGAAALSLVSDPPVLSRLTERSSEGSISSPSKGQASEATLSDSPRSGSPEPGTTNQDARSEASSPNVMSQSRLSALAMQIGGQLTVQPASSQSSLAAGSSCDSPTDLRGSTAETPEESGFLVGPTAPKSSTSVVEAEAQAQADIREMEAARTHGEAAMRDLHERRKRSVEKALEALQEVEIEIGSGPSQIAQAGHARMRSVQANITVTPTAQGSGSALDRARALRQAYRTLAVDRDATPGELEAALVTQLQVASNEAEKAGVRHAYSQIIVGKPTDPRPVSSTSDTSQAASCKPHDDEMSDMRI